jgi:hypothetical protein
VNGAEGYGLKAVTTGLRTRHTGGHLPDYCGHHNDQPAKMSAFAQIRVGVASGSAPISDHKLGLIEKRMRG